MIEINEIRFEDLEKGSEMPKLTKGPIDQIQLVKYAGASGDFNPLHTDPEFGKKTGTGQIAHGMLIMGFAGEALINWISKKHIRKLSVRFVGVTRPGDLVTITGMITEKRQESGTCLVSGELMAVNQNDNVLLTGSFTASKQVE